MRILQLGKFYPVKGGVEKVMFDLMMGLSEQNFPCDMLCVSLNNENEKIVLSSNANLYTVKHYGKYASTYVSFQMIRWLRKNKNNYSIIHIHHPDPMAALALLFSGFKGDVYLHWHSDIIRQKLFLNAYLPIQNYLLKRANKVIGTSPTYLNSSKHLSAFKEKMVCVPIGINEKDYGIDIDKVVQLKNKFKNKKIVFALGRFVYYKGFEYLIKSALSLNDDAIIVIGGTGPLFAKCDELIRELKLEHKVFLLGYLKDEEVVNYFAACDIYCMSSIEKSEAFGIVLIEAMMFGKPIVSTRIEGSGVVWVNEENYSGLIAAPADDKSLGDAINKVLSDFKLQLIFSKNARTRFEEMFCRKNMVEEVIKIYEKKQPKIFTNK